MSILRKIFSVLLCSYFLFGCNSERKNLPADNKITDPIYTIQKSKALLKNGDLVLRSDNDVTSLALRNFSRKDKTFSHCGIAYFENQSWYIYHIMSGTENPSGIIKKVLLDSFVNPHIKTGFGIFRYSLSENERQRLYNQIQQFYSRQIHFDNKFDLVSDDQLYCAEMIYKALKVATNNRVILPTTVQTNFRDINSPNEKIIIKKLEYVALDNLFLNRYCEEIIRFYYKNSSLERN